MAEKPCRSCEVRYNELANSFSEDSFVMRDEAEHRDRCNILDEIKGETKRLVKRIWNIWKKFTTTGT